jgi:excisionase family DNA binding protein
VSTEGDAVHGLRAAAKLTGWSASGIQKMIDAGRVRAEKVGRAYSFRAADLEAIRRGHTRSKALTATSASPDTPVTVSAPGTAAPPPGDQEIGSGPHADSMDAGTHDGDVAAIVFGDLAAGHSLTRIVVDRRLLPDLVRRFFGEWRALSDVDALLKPEAEVRLAEVEARVEALADKLAVVEATIRATSAQCAHAWQRAERRLRGLDLRVNAASGGSAVAEMRERLTALEGVVRGLPAVPIPTGHRCPRCGQGQLVTLAACGGCGLGTGPAA